MNFPSGPYAFLPLRTDLGDEMLEGSFAKQPEEEDLPLEPEEGATWPRWSCLCVCFIFPA